MMSKVFYNHDSRGEYGKKLWNIIHRLDKLGLIWIEKNEDGKINHIHKHGQLYTKMAELFPHLVIKRITLQQVYKLYLDQNQDKSKSNHPDFLGILPSSFRMLIDPSIEYRYVAWINELGKLFLKIESFPKEDNENEK